MHENFHIMNTDVPASVGAPPLNTTSRDECSQTIPIFCSYSAYMYYIEWKPKNAGGLEMRLHSWCSSGKSFQSSVSFSKDMYHVRQCHITSIYGSFHARFGQHPPAWSGSRTVGKRDGLGSALYRVGRSLQNTILLIS